MPDETYGSHVTYMTGLSIGVALDGASRKNGADDIYQFLL